MFVRLVLGALAFLLLTSSANASPLLAVSKLLAYSALATDDMQTRHVIQFSKEDPLCIEGAALCVWEDTVPSDPSWWQDHVAFTSTTYSALEHFVGDTWASILLVGHALARIPILIRNNENAPGAMLPQYAMIAYQFHF